jgi:hypothetical protein
MTRRGGLPPIRIHLFRARPHRRRQRFRSFGGVHARLMRRGGFGIGGGRYVGTRVCRNGQMQRRVWTDAILVLWCGALITGRTRLGCRHRRRSVAGRRFPDLCARRPSCSVRWAFLAWLGHRRTACELYPETCVVCHRRSRCAAPAPIEHYTRYLVGSA